MKTCDVCCGLVGACSRSAVYDKIYKEIETDTKLSDSLFIREPGLLQNTTCTQVYTLIYTGIYRVLQCMQVLRFLTAADQISVNQLRGTD